ncbi:MAG: thioredoxin domain-containing protein [Hyphomicrobiaceae bacterium]
MSENRLSRETSPYLLQHRDNPVHWWAWGPEALDEAKRTGKPILLSVGYAACHWCHVMAHESFEDQGTADVMNELFVNIKVDREERPDIDAIYMGALHRLGEQGGWPLTMFLDTDARPFWGGTYFPKDGRYGKPPFVAVLRQVAHIFANDRETVDHNANAITAMLTERAPVDGTFAITDKGLDDLTSRLLRAVDADNGGLQGAPKFPQWNFFWLLWRGAIRYDQPLAKAAVEKTLIHICQGGIYDHLGGGFARYATDEKWLVPHFEKMLYDNALLIDLMSEVYRETGNRLFEVRVAETVAWLEREMIAEGGAFAASLDADSEGEEGKFYVWTFDELVAVLGEEVAKVFGQIYDVKPGGNWEGRAILNRLNSRELMSAAEEDKLGILKRRLLAVRDKRVRPGFDDKVLADWNGLMISALAKAAVVFKRPEWTALAERAFAFVTTRMCVDGRLRHCMRAGRTTVSATASDYANMIAAALRLHEATGAQAYVAAGLDWVAVLDRHYWVADGGGYATTAEDTADVIVRLRTAADDAVPNANAVMLSNLMQLFLLTGKGSFLDRAEALDRAFSGEVRAAMPQHTGFLASSMDLIAPQMVVVTAGDGVETLHDAASRIALPGALVCRLGTELDTAIAGFEGKCPINGKAAAYLCIGPQCAAPITDAEALVAKLRELRRAVIVS